jgi:hypothetical protein
VDSNVGGRLYGSDGHAFIVRLRVVATFGLWFAAMLGFARQALGRRLNIGLLALTVSPFPLLALQSYGGEVLLRIAFFCMPFMAFAAATLFVAPGERLGRKSMAALATAAVLMVAAFPFLRYGNERMDYYSKAELAGVKTMYRIAPPGSHLFAGSGAFPWRFTGYADYPTDTILNSASPVDLDYEHPEALARSVAKYMAEKPGQRSYLIITRSMGAQADLFGYLPVGAMPRLREILVASPLFRVAYENPDAVILTLKR